MKRKILLIALCLGLLSSMVVLSVDAQEKETQTAEIQKTSENNLFSEEEFIDYKKTLPFKLKVFQKMKYE